MFSGFSFIDTEDMVLALCNKSSLKSWEKFRGYLSVDVMLAFMDKVSISALGAWQYVLGWWKPFFLYPLFYA